MVHGIISDLLTVAGHSVSTLALLGHVISMRRTRTSDTVVLRAESQLFPFVQLCVHVPVLGREQCREVTVCIMRLLSLQISCAT